MGNIRAVIFDLDGVLLDEAQYVCAAHKEIARFLSGKCAVSESEIYEKLKGTLRQKGSMYPRLFDDVVQQLGLSQELVPEILKIYGRVDAKLTLCSGADVVLRSLRRRGVKLGLVTNGMVAAQQNKVRLLGLEKRFDVVVFARKMQREKPSSEAYEAALEALSVKPEEALCVGDNPYTDFVGAKQLGMRTVRLLCGEFKDVRLSGDFEAEFELNNLGELPGLVRCIGKV